MRKKSIVVNVLCIMIIGTLFLACGNGQAPTEQETPATTPTEQNFTPPVVTLNSVQVAHYWGWWYYKKDVEPTKGTAGDYGAPLDLAFVFDIENPNAYPVMLDNFKFTVAFEDFDLNTLNVSETQWVPAGKTNQLRVHAMFDGRQSLLSLLVTGGFKLEEKGTDAFGQLETWWNGIPEFSFPVTVKEGAAVFTADGITTIAAFGGSFPQE